MIKVVIVSDQTDGSISELVDWQTYDMEITTVSNDPFETMNLVQKYKPELLIYSVLLNESKSLEIIESCKSINENLSVIIISGLKDFDYLKMAVRCGISDFLTVPLKYDDLDLALHKIRKNYIKRAQLFENRDTDNDVPDDMRAKFFSDLLTKKNSSAGLTIDRVNKYYNFNFAHGFFRVFIVKLDWPCENYYDIAEINPLIQKLVAALKKSLITLCYDLQFYIQGGRIYAVVNYKKSNYPKIKNELEILIEEFHKYNNVSGKCITLGLSSPATDINSLGCSIFEAEAALMQRIIEGTNKIIENSLVISNNSFLNTDFSELPIVNNFSEKVRPILEGLQKDKLEAIIDDFKSDIFNISVKGIEFLSIMHRTCYDCLNYLCSHSLCLNELEQQYFVYKQKADLCISKNELIQLLSNTLSLALDRVARNLEGIETKPIRLAKRYIEQNFYDSITLETVADFVGFNSAYFSTLFKKESGQNFSDYIFGVRMTKAQEMLKKTNLKIDTICGKVGYKDLKHFTQSFKRLTGLNPSQYRRVFS